MLLKLCPILSSQDPDLPSPWIPFGVWLANRAEFSEHGCFVLFSSLRLCQKWGVSRSVKFACQAPFILPFSFLPFLFSMKFHFVKPEMTSDFIETFQSRI